MLPISSRRLRANASKVRSGILPERVTTKTGNKLKFISFIFGSFVSDGRLVFAKSTFSRTSVIAFSASNPASNSRTILAPLSYAELRTSFTPSILRSELSTGCNNNRSLSSGEIPSCLRRMYINGISISGSASFGISI